MFWKKLLAKELHSFSSLETYVIWNLVFVIRWEKSLFFNSFLEISIAQELFFVFSLSFYQLIIFFLTNYSSFSTSGMVNLLFSGFWECDLIFREFFCCKVSSVCDLIDLFSNVSIIWRSSISRRKWFKYQFYRTLFVICHHIFDTIQSEDLVKVLSLH